MRPTWARNLTFEKYCKIFLVITTAIAFFYGVGFAIPLEGPWVDLAASKFLSRKTGLLIRFEKTKIFHWSQIFFKTVVIGVEGQHQLLTAGPGTVYFKKLSLTIIDLKDLYFAEDFHLSDFFSSWPIAKGLEGKFLVSQLRAGFLSGRSEGLIRIFKCESDAFSLRGGLVLKAKRIAKAHIYLSLRSARLKKLPLQIRTRMIEKKGGWAALHVVFYHNQLTLSGHRGPLFQAKWQGKGLGVLA